MCAIPQLVSVPLYPLNPLPNLTFLFSLHKDTYQLPLLAFSLANGSKQRKKHKVIQWEEFR